MKAVCVRQRLFGLAISICASIGFADEASAAILTVCPSGCAYSDVQTAIEVANSGDTVQLGEGEYPVSYFKIRNSGITLKGQGPKKTVLNAGQRGPVITVEASASVTVQDLGITNGLSGDGSGSGVRNEGSTTIRNCEIFKNNWYTLAGEIYNSGVMFVEGSSIHDHPFYAIKNKGTLNINNSVISAVDTGIVSVGGRAQLGVYNTTFSVDQIALESYYGSISLAQVTASGTTSIDATGGTVWIRNSVLGSTTNCVFKPMPQESGTPPSIVSFGNNIATDSRCGLTHASDLQNVSSENLALGPLTVPSQGAVPFIPLLPGSVAIDKFDCFGGGYDQRGVARPQGDRCDSGAFELQAPIARDDKFVVTQDTVLNTNLAGIPGVLSNDAAPDGVPTVVDSTTSAAHGSPFISAGGDLLYLPDPGFIGTDTFTYRLIDDASHIATAAVTIDVKPVNHPPVANDDAFSVLAGHVLTVPGMAGLLANDSDPDGNVLSAVVAGEPINGTVKLNADGSFSYTPNAGFSGADAFSYQANDGQSLSEKTNVAIDVKPYVAALTIVEDAQPDAPTNFRFSSDLGNFILDDPAGDDGDAYGQSKSFEVTPGSYVIKQTKLAGWLTGSISCNPIANSIPDVEQSTVRIKIRAGDKIVCTFVNQRPGRLNVKAYNDLNRDQRRTGNEPWLSGWQVHLMKAPNSIQSSMLTNGKGQAVFTNLQPKMYTVCEALQPSWKTVNPPQADPNYGLPCFGVDVKPGQTTSITFGNAQ